MAWDEVSWIMRGRLRKKVLESLDKPKTATNLSKELDTHRSTVSDVLKQFTDKGYMVCLNPTVSYNRYYERTSKERRYWKKLEKLSKN